MIKKFMLLLLFVATPLLTQAENGSLGAKKKIFKNQQSAVKGKLGKTSVVLAARCSSSSKRSCHSKHKCCGKRGPRGATGATGATGPAGSAPVLAYGDFFHVTAFGSTAPVDSVFTGSFFPLDFSGRVSGLTVINTPPGVGLNTIVVPNFTSATTNYNVEFYVEALQNNRIALVDAVTLVSFPSSIHETFTTGQNYSQAIVDVPPGGRSIAILNQGGTFLPSPVILQGGSFSQPAAVSVSLKIDQID